MTKQKLGFAGLAIALILLLLAIFYQEPVDVAKLDKYRQTSRTLAQIWSEQYKPNGWWRKQEIGSNTYFIDQVLVKKIAINQKKQFIMFSDGVTTVHMNLKSPSADTLAVFYINNGPIYFEDGRMSMLDVYRQIQNFTPESLTVEQTSSSKQAFELWSTAVTTFRELVEDL